MPSTTEEFYIRAFKPSDAPQVAPLLQTYFPWKQQVPARYIEEALTHFDIKSSQSLVCISKNESIHGYLSVKLLPFQLEGQSLTGAFAVILP